MFQSQNSTMQQMFSNGMEYTEATSHLLLICHHTMSSRWSCREAESSSFRHSSHYSFLCFALSSKTKNIRNGQVRPDVEWLTAHKISLTSCFEGCWSLGAWRIESSSTCRMVLLVLWPYDMTKNLNAHHLSCSSSLHPLADKFSWGPLVRPSLAPEGFRSWHYYRHVDPRWGCDQPAVLGSGVGDRRWQRKSRMRKSWALGDSLVRCSMSSAKY